MLNWTLLVLERGLRISDDIHFRWKLPISKLFMLIKRSFYYNSPKITNMKSIIMQVCFYLYRVVFNESMFWVDHVHQLSYDLYCVIFEDVHRIYRGNWIKFHYMLSITGKAVEDYLVPIVLIFLPEIRQS